MRDLNQVAAKLEATPGTAEALVAGDVRMRIRDGDLPDFPFEAIETEEVQDFSSSRPMLIGTKEFRSDLSWLLRPSGTTPASIQHATSRFFEAGMLNNKQIKTITIGSVTGGPFTRGETITGGTSGATGEVYRDVSSTPMRYFLLTGTFASAEVITGGTSGATATTSSTGSADGFAAVFNDSEFAGSDKKHHMTYRFLRDGFYWEGRGCLGELSMEFRVDRFCVVRQSVLGGFSAHGDVALFTVDPYPDESVAAPRFVNASLTMGGYSPTDVVDFNLTMPLGLELRQDANDADGVLYADYDRRSSPPTITFDPAMVKKATKDFFLDYKDGTSFAMTWKLGTKFTFYADDCQIVSAGVGTRRAVATIPFQIRLNGTVNDEIYIESTP